MLYLDTEDTLKRKKLDIIQNNIFQNIGKTKIQPNIYYSDVTLKPNYNSNINLKSSKKHAQIISKYK